MGACCCSDWIGRLAHTEAARLAAIARREGASAIDALDLVQDAFHTLMLRADAVRLREADDTAGAARLLSAIVQNAARNHRRRAHVRLRSDVDVGEMIDAAPATEAQPDAALERVETMTALVGCMAELGDAHRHVITLRVLEELSGSEAAVALGVTPGHVAVLLHRAREQLARCMVRSTA